MSSTRFFRVGLLAVFVLALFLLPTAQVAAISTGAKTASSNAAVTTNAGDNNGFQTTPGNTTANDNNFAVDTDTGTGAVTDGCGTFPQSESDQHDFYDFNLGVPTNATVNGITLDASSLWDATTGTNELCFALSWDGGTSWTTATGTGDVNGTEVATTRGGSANTWGRTWTGSELSNANFRVRVMAEPYASNARDVSLDYLAITVDYVAPLTVSGVLYSDEGVNTITSPKTIKLAVGTSTISTYSTSTDTSGNWNIIIPAGHSIVAGTPMIAFVDGDSVNATVFTKASSTADINGLNLYQNRVIVRHEGTSGTSTRNVDMAFYDADDEPGDILYTATTSLLSVTSGTQLYVWSGKTFAPGGAVIINGNGGAGLDGSFHLAANSTYTAAGTTTIAGNLTASSSVTYTPHASGTVFIATSTGKVLNTPFTNYGNLIFDGVGGAWSFSQSHATTSDFIILNGTVTAPSDQIVIKGDNLRNLGTFTSATSTVISGRGDVGISGSFTGSSTLGDVTFLATNDESGQTVTIATSGFTNEVASVIDEVNGVLYVGKGGTTTDLIHRCVLSSGCDESSDFVSVLAVDANSDYFSSLAIDTDNQILYAAQQFIASGDSLLSRCALSTQCDTASDWTTVLSTTTNLFDVVYDPVTQALYTGGPVYRCLTSTGCDSSSEWTSIGGSGYQNMYVDSISEALFGVTSSRFVYRCPLSSDCDNSSDFTLARSLTTGTINGFATDISAQKLYFVTEGGSASSSVYVCTLSTLCDASGDYSVLISFTWKSIESIAIDQASNIIYIAAYVNPSSYSDPRIYRCLIETGCASGSDWQEVIYNEANPNTGELYYSTAYDLLIYNSRDNYVYIRETMLQEVLIGDDFESEDFTLSDARVSINGDGAVLIGGDFTNNGQYLLSTTSTTTFSGINAQTATGTLTFGNLAVTNISATTTFGATTTVSGALTAASGATLAFLAGATSTFNSVNITGTEGNEIQLRSTLDGTRFGFVVSDTYDISYIDVKDSSGTSTLTGLITATSSLDSGNNVGWTFASGGSAESTIGLGGATCVANDKTASTTLTCTVATESFDVGNYAVMWFAGDNTATVDGNDQLLSSVSDTQGNNWTVERCFTNSRSAAAGGATTCIATAKIATALTTSDAITATFSSITAKAISVREFNVSAETHLRIAGNPQDDARLISPQAMTVTGLSGAVKDYLFVRSVALERTAPGTWSTTVNFTNVGCSGTSGGLNASNMEACGEFRILSTSTSPTSNPTGSADDNASIYVAFEAYSFALAGTLFLDAGVTSATNTYTIKIAFGTSTPSVHSTTTTAAGDWAYTPSSLSALTTGTPVLVWVDGDAAFTAGTFTKINGATSVEALDLYRDRLIIRDELTVATTTQLAELGFYDATDDSDIPYTVTGTSSLRVHNGAALYIAADTIFNPEGQVIVSGNAEASATDGSLYVYGEYTPLATTTLAGNLYIDSDASFRPAPAGLVFNATTTYKFIKNLTDDSLGIVQFNGTGGGWLVETSATTSDFTISTGEVGLPRGVLRIEGNLEQNGTLIERGGVVELAQPDNQVAGDLSSRSLGQLRIAAGDARSTTRISMTDEWVVSSVIDQTTGTLFVGTGGDGGSPLIQAGIYRCVLSSGCDESGDFGLAYEAASGTEITSLLIDSVNRRLYASDNAGTIYHCLMLLNCDASGDFTETYNTVLSAIEFLLVDERHGVLYAGGGASSTLYRCNLTTACNASEDFTTAFTSTEDSFTSGIIDYAYGVMYIGSESGGIIYRCVLATGCDAAGDFSVAYDTPGAVINVFAIDTESRVLYVGTGNSGIISRCVLATGCDAAGDFDNAYDTAATQIYALYIDEAKGMLYAGGDTARFYTCVLSTQCNSIGDYSTVTLGSASDNIRSITGAPNTTALYVAETQLTRFVDTATSSVVITDDLKVGSFTVGANASTTLPGTLTVAESYENYGVAYGAGTTTFTGFAVTATGTLTSVSAFDDVVFVGHGTYTSGATSSFPYAGVITDPSTGFDEIIDMADDADSLYVTGSCNGCGSSGGYAIYTVAYDKETGAVLWATSTDPSSGEDVGQKVAVDDTTVYVNGYCTGCGGVGGDALYLVAYNKTTGVPISTTTIDVTSGADRGVGVSVDSNFIYINGRCENCGALGGSAIYTAKIAKSDRSIIWSRIIDATSNFDYGIDIGIDAAGVYGLGFCTGCGGTGLAAYYHYKLDRETGGLIWATSTDPTAGSDVPYDMELDGETLYMTGYCATCGDSSSNAWYTVARSKNDGSLRWATSTNNSTADDRAYGIAIDDEKVYLTGHVIGRIPVDTEYYAVASLNKTTGEFLDLESLTTNGSNTRARSVVVDGAYVYTSGYCTVCGALGGTAYFLNKFTKDELTQVNGDNTLTLGANASTSVLSLATSTTLTTAGNLAVTNTLTAYGSTTLTFAAGATTTVQNLNLLGTASSTIRLNSTASGTQSAFVLTGTASVTYATIKDSTACGSVGGRISVYSGNNTDGGNTTCWEIVFDPADYLTVSGTLYQSDRSTPVTTGETVSLALVATSTMATFSTTTDASGNFSFSIYLNALIATSTPLSLYLNDNNAIVQAVTVTKTNGSSTITNLPLSLSRLTVTHEATSGTSTTITDLAHYDADDDSDIPYTANGGVLTVARGTDLLVQEGKTFTPGGAVNASSSLTIATGATYNAPASTTVNGTLANQGTFTHNDGTLTMDGIYTDVLSYLAGRDESGNADGTGSASMLLSLTTVGNYLYAGKNGNTTACSQTAGSAQGCELMVFDISSTTNPIYVAGRDASGNSDGTGSVTINSLAIVGTTLYVGRGASSTACSQTAGSAIGCELMIFDISSTTNPIYVAGRDASGNADGTGSVVINFLTTVGNTLYVGKDSSATACSQTAGSAIGCELMIFDISSTTNPIYVAGRDASGNSDGTGSVIINSLATVGNYLYAGKSASSTACSQTAGSAIGCEIMVFDISSTTNPIYVAGRDASGNSDGTGSVIINSLTTVGTTLYVGKNSSTTACSQTAGSAIGCELMVFDISSTTNPIYVAGRDVSGNADGTWGSVVINFLTTVGNYLYAGKTNNTTACSQTAGSAIGCELMVFDISSTTNPIYVAGRDASGNSDGTGSVIINSLATAGNYLYVGKRNNTTACSQTAGSAIGCELMVFSANLGDAGVITGTLTGSSALNDTLTKGVVSVFMNASTTDLTITAGTTTFPAALSVSGSYTNDGIVVVPPSSTQDFTGGSAQTIAGTLTGSSAFSNLIFSGTGTKTLANNASTTDLIITAGATVVAPDHLTLAGNYINSGTFTADNGLVEIKSYITDYLAGRDASGNSGGAVGVASIRSFTSKGDAFYIGKSGDATACSQTAGSAIGCELMVFDISSTTNPIYVAGRDVSGNATGTGSGDIDSLTVVGNDLYVGKSGNATACSQTAGSAIGCELMVFNISSSTNPIYVAGRDVTGNNTGTGAIGVSFLTIAGNTLYVGKSGDATACSQTAGSAIGCELMVFNISSSTNPIYVAGRDVTGNNTGAGTIGVSFLTTVGTTLYVGNVGNATACSQTAGAASGCELMVFNISSSTNPIYVAGRDATGDNTGIGNSWVYFLATVDNTLYVGKSGAATACSQTAGAASGCELMVFDISSTTNPIYVAGRDSSGGSDGTKTVPIDSLTIVGNALYVGKRNGTGAATACSQTAGSAEGCELMVFDISSTTNPIYVAGRDSSGGSDGTKTVTIDFLATVGNTLYVGKSGDATACSQTAGSAIGCELMVFDLASNLSGTMTGSSALADVSITGVGADFMDAASTTNLTLATSSSLTTAGNLAVTNTLTAYGNTTLTLAAGATTTVQNLNLLGTASSTIRLTSIASGTQSNFVLTGTAAVTYTTIKDSAACGSVGGAIDVSTGNNTDGGNTTCWTYVLATSTPVVALPESYTFYAGQGTTTLGTITITEASETPVITSASDLRLTIATTTTNFRFDTAVTAPTFGGTAAGKVAGTVSYADGGATLLVDVTENFTASNTLTIAGLQVGSFTSVSTTTSQLALHTDGDSAGTPTVTSSETFRIVGSLVLGEHSAAQTDNQFSWQNRSMVPVYAFSLSPTGETATVTDIVVTLRGINEISTSDVSNLDLYRDNNSNGEYDGGDTLIDGNGIMTINGQHGAITFSADFLATTTRDYIVTADTQSIVPGAAVTFVLNTSGVTATGQTSQFQPVVTGIVSSIQHIRNVSGGGGSSSRIGGNTPTGNGVITGGGSGGGTNVGQGQDGENIAYDPDFRAPQNTGTPNNEWTNGTNALASDGTYATAASTNLRQSYYNFGFSLPTGNSVQGIAVKLDASGSTADGTIDVALSWDNGSSYTSAKATPTVSGSDIVYTVGGTADTWGRSWTPTEFNNGSFILRVTAQPASNTIRLDALEVRVYHQATGGGSGGGGVGGGRI